MIGKEEREPDGWQVTKQYCAKTWASTVHSIALEGGREREREKEREREREREKKAVALWFCLIHIKSCMPLCYSICRMARTLRVLRCTWDKKKRGTRRDESSTPPASTCTASRGRGCDCLLQSF